MSDPTLPLKNRGKLIGMICNEIHDGGEALDNIPASLVKLYESGYWREFEIYNGTVVRHERFIDLITGDLPNGFRTPLAFIDKLMRGTKHEPKWQAIKAEELEPAAKHGGDRAEQARDTLLMSHHDNTEGILPVLAVFVGSGFRAMPLTSCRRCRTIRPSNQFKSHEAEHAKTASRSPTSKNPVRASSGGRLLLAA